MKTLLSTLFILLINLVASAQQSLTATIQYNNIAATGDYTIISNDAITMSQVDKPLIIVEGFDPTNEISNFELLSMFNKLEGNRLGDQFLNEGYDIIILNFANGGDYIQRNAFLLIELINQINTSKTGNEQLVICGVSMGGLVARYALSYMEHHSLNHNTRLFISFDAPNKGAYIPISLQYLLKVHSNFFPIIGIILDQTINSPAARQMLLVHHLATSSGSHPYTVNQSSLRTDFVAELQALGNYPILCRKIAVSNGNKSGVRQKKSDGSSMSSVQDFLFQYGSPGFSGYGSSLFHKSFDQNNNEVAGVILGHQELLQSTNFIATFGLQNFEALPGGNYPWVEQIMDEYTSAGLNPVSYVKSPCFIPTASALDLDFPVSEWHRDFSEFDDLLCHSAFDAIYAPNLDNYNHTDLPYITSNWLFNQINPNSTLMINSGVAWPLNTEYNFGLNTPDNINRDITISPGATLGINLGRPIDFFHKNLYYGNINSTDIPIQGSSFKVITNRCKSSVTITNNGVLEIGDGVRYGTLIINAGGKLLLKQNSQLTIGYGSKIVVENGGKLVFENGAAITLYEQSYIEVKPGGKIEIAENATFTWSGKGYLKINTNTWGLSNIVATGPNAKFQKTGGGYGPFDEKLVEITGGGSLSVDKSLAEFKLQRGYVLMDEHTLLDVESKMRCYFVKFTTNNTNKKHAGIMVYGQQNEAYLDNCIVENAGWGILMLNNSGNATQAKIVATKFINNEIGVYIQGKGADLSYCTFWRNTHAAIQLDMLTLPANLYKINAEGNGNGLLSNSTNFSLINITDSKIYQNLSGVKVTGGTLTVGCSKIYNNYGPNLHLKNQTTLGLEPARWAKTGNNYFYNDFTTSIELNNAWSLYMDKGKNHFQVNPNYSSQVINGTLRSAGVWWQRLVFPIVASQNYWNINGTSPVMQTVSASNDYLITQKYRTATVNIPIVDGSPFSAAPTFSDCSSGNSLPYNPGDQPSALIGKPNLALSNGDDIKDYFMTGLDKLYIQNNYDAAISIFELIVKHDYGTDNDIQLTDDVYISEQGLWSEVVYAAYEKMLESLTSGIHAGVIGDYESDPDLYNKVRLAQEHLIGNIIAADTLAYEHWFKLSLDNAIIYKLMGDLNTCYNKLDNLKAVSFHTSTNANLVNYTFCRVENEINLRDSAITKMDYAIALKNCISELGYTYPTTTLNVGEEPADPSEEGYFGKKGNDANKSNAAPNQLADEQSSDEVNVYPNPSNGLIIINASGVKVESVTIYNKLGMKVATYNNTDTINISQSGLFILEIKTDKGTYRKKVVVQ